MVPEGRLPGLDHVGEGTGDWIFPTWLPERAPCAVSLVSAQVRRQRCSSPWPLSPSEYEVVKRGSALALPLASPLPCMTGSPWRLPAFPTGSSLLQLSSRPFSALCVSVVAQSCPALCDPVDCSLRGSSVHEIFLARTLEWVAIFFLLQGISLTRIKPASPMSPALQTDSLPLSYQGSPFSALQTPVCSSGLSCLARVHVPRPPRVSNTPLS